ncbi:hypothetical protein VOLCADRAFT_95483 [Volvox carteri f. nagariensis]|uniref:Uncharacterized protein n=1 Tax=Volvox carteri f. nagariensis TaxID=3068 RepID=D8U7K9_VOLCA|nr:uncharacterized protein VOLCADRAFT_95483 [Volvox carteri f. nagariensis]EFJ44254.1 hypothetical protein VOLCADRAFT_95483 [Volvox carteri f. nagariensis]|eukprot:XP_002954613.1 hypothetical protein VOLCADRAFT_95483 [Volvox carteri f. nagariensis]
MRGRKKVKPALATVAFSSVSVPYRLPASLSAPSPLPPHAVSLRKRRYVPSVSCSSSIPQHPSPSPPPSAPGRDSSLHTGRGAFAPAPVIPAAKAPAAEAVPPDAVVEVAEVAVVAVVAAVGGVGATAISGGEVGTLGLRGRWCRGIDS